MHARYLYLNIKAQMKRREFVKNIVKAGAVLGFPTIIPASALGKDGAVAPSQRVTMGVIGLGTQGTSNTRNFQGDKRVQLVALCDVNNSQGRQYYGYKNNGTYGLRNARELFGKDIPCYNDFRDVLARKDIDVISTATPDHWHAIIGIACAKAGKDVDSAQVQAKAQAAIRWCEYASEHALKNGGVPWKYLLIPDTAVLSNATLEGLVAKFAK